MTTDTHYYLGFSHAHGIGPFKLQKLIERCGSIAHAWQAPESILLECLGVKLTHDFIAFRSYFRSDSILKSLLKKCVQTTHIGDKNWPKKLSNIPDPPICLYIRGNINILTEQGPAVGIVGTRKPSSYGADITENWSSSLAQHDITIISGMALGIDSIAHRTALDHDSKTIAVLGCGVDTPFPTTNQKLYERILESESGCIVSEYPPGTPPLPGQFVSRNRIVSALSDYILVIEGSEKSGTLTTASHAASQGRDVYCIPGPITSPQSSAPNFLIKSGAHVALSPYDLIDRFAELGQLSKKQANSNVKTHSHPIIAALKDCSSNFSSLSKRTHLSAQELTIELSKLELLQQIVKLPTGEYKLNRRV